MKNQTMNQTMTNWQSTSVVPTHAFGMGDLRPQAVVGFAYDTSSLKRHAAAIKATRAMGPQPWSPPVT